MTVESPAQSAPGTARRGGREARRTLRTDRTTPMLPALKRNLPLVEPLSPEQIEKIDRASMDILEEVGVVFRDPVAIEDWRRAGADVRADFRVHLDRNLVRQLIASIPPSFTYHARNPANNLPFGAGHAIFAPMTGAPFLRDLDDVRRSPALADLGTFHKLAHMSPALHSTAHHIVEPMDVVVAHRHLHITYSSMKHSDKMFMGMTTSPKNAEDVLDMCALLFGADFMETHPVVTGNCNGNSPLVWDEVMLGAMRAFCRRNQPILCSPFVLGGAKVFDAQAGYESASTMMAVLLAGANYIWHSAGWNEGGLHCSIAKFVVDAEQCAMGYRMAEGVRWDDFDEALAAVRDVGPGGHYLGHPHTQANFQRAFFMPKLFDNNSIEQWIADGSKDTTARALAEARAILDAYEEPKLDAGIDESLRDYIARREREIPAVDALNNEF